MTDTTNALRALVETIDADALGRFAQDEWMDAHPGYPSWGRLDEAEHAAWLAVGVRIKRVLVAALATAQPEAKPEGVDMGESLPAWLELHSLLPMVRVVEDRRKAAAAREDHREWFLSHNHVRELTYHFIRDYGEQVLQKLQQVATRQAQGGGEDS